MAQEQIGEIAQLLKLHIEASKENHTKIISKLEEQDKQLQAILLQAQKTNGRVLSLEETRKENEKKFELVDSLNNYRWWATGIFAVVTIAGGTMYALAISNLEYKIVDKVEMMLDERVDGVYFTQ